MCVYVRVRSCVCRQRLAILHPSSWATSSMTPRSFYRFCWTAYMKTSTVWKTKSTLSSGMLTADQTRYWHQDKIHTPIEMQCTLKLFRSPKTCVRLLMSLRCLNFERTKANTEFIENCLWSGMVVVRSYSSIICHFYKTSVQCFTSVQFILL